MANLCECFKVPSRVIEGDYEGFGIVYFEANLDGKPVIIGQSGEFQWENEICLKITPYLLRGCFIA